MADEGEESEASKKTATGRPTNTVVWENVSQEEFTKDDGSKFIKQTCLHCGRVNNAQKPQTTWWSLHLVDRDKGCQNCPLAIRHAILSTTTSQSVRTAGMSLFGVSASGKRGRKALSSSSHQQSTTAGGTRRGLSALLEQNLEITTTTDGQLSQTCRHCGRNRVCKQMLATVWSLHFVDISPKGCQHCPFYVRRAIAQESSSSAVRRVAERNGWFVGGNGGYDDDDDDDVVRSTRGPGRPPKRAKTSGYNSHHRNAYGGGGGGGSGGGGLTNTQANTISMKVMQFLTACGHSMLLVQSPVFLELLRSLNDEYVRRHLSKAEVFVKSWLPKLYQSVQSQLSTLWQEQRKQQSVGTLGLWDEMPKAFLGPPVKILTEGMVDKLAFWETVSASEEGETADGLAQHLSNHMVAKAGDETKVEDTYCAVCLTTSELNNAVGEIIEERFPKLFVNQCRQQTLRKMRESIFQVPEIAQAYCDAQFLANFILNHLYTSTVFAGFANEKGGTMPVAATSQDFGPVHKLLESVCGPNKINAEVFSALARDTDWISDSAQTINPQLVQQFETLVADAETFNKFDTLKKLLAPLAAFTGHLNRPECRASWMYSLFEAIMKDVSEWCDDPEAKRSFLRLETFEKVSDAVKHCCYGDGMNGQSKGLSTPQSLVAMLLDPTTCPTSEALPSEWESESEKVLKRFYSGKDLLDANAELMTVLDHQGKFGSHVERFQEALKTVDPSPEGTNHVQKVIVKQLTAMETVPHLVWKLSLRSSFPLLQEVARRVLVMGTTSIDASWTMKVEKALGQNGIKNKKVLMMLYCHINLRVMKYKENRNLGMADDPNSFEEFLSQALVAEEDEPDPAAPAAAPPAASAQPNMKQEEQESLVETI